MLAAWITSQIAFNGVVQGLVYGLLAMAIVLVYRSSKVINFAIGAMGLIGSSLLVLLTIQFGVPYWIALALALLAGVVYGAIIELAVVRRLFTAPRVILLVATIGVSQLSVAILVAFPDIDNSRAGYPLPFDTEYFIGDLRIKPALVAVVVVVPLVALALGWFLNRTLLGRTVRAAAVNPDLARLRGVNPKTISTLVWAIGGGVATIAMILIGGIDGSAGSLSNLGPQSLLRALTAALIGRFISFKIALAAGVVIGLAEGVIRFNFLANPGLVDLLLLVVVLVAVASFPRERGGDAVFSFNPRVDAMPERLRSIFWVRHLDRITMLTLLGLAILAPFIFTKASQHVVYAAIAAFTICALSLTVLTGWAGQLSLGQMAFAGIAAFTGAALTRGLEIDWIFYIRFEPMPFALSILLAAVFVAGVAALIGSGALRVTGLLLAVSTFAFAVTAGAWIYQLKVFTPEQTTLFPRGSIFGLDLNEERTYYFVILAVLAVLVAVLGRLRRSPVGRVTLAVRDNATTAAAYTVRPAIVKLRTFALSGAIAGLGGGLLAGVAQRVSFADSRYAVAGSLLLVSVVVIGGMSSLAGAIIGSIYVVGIPALFPANELVPLLTSSMGLLVLLLYFPGGLANVAYRIRGSIYRNLESKLPPVEKRATVAPSSIRRADVRTDMPDVMLEADDIVVTFGGVCANDRVSIEVRRNEIVGLIGTNGAGKTTLMNAIGGYVPSSGRVDVVGRGRQRPGTGDAGPQGPRAIVPGGHAVPGTHRSRHDLGGTRSAQSQRHGRDAAVPAAGPSDRRGPAHRSVRADRLSRPRPLRRPTDLGAVDRHPSHRRTRRAARRGARRVVPRRTDRGYRPARGRSDGPVAHRHPQGTRRSDAHHRTRHAAHHEHERPGLLPRTRHGHRRRRPVDRAQRPEGHRQLPRHGRTHDRPQRQQGADVDPDADGSVRAHGRYRHTGSQFTSSPSRWRQV